MRIVLPPLNFLTVLPLRALLLFPPSLGSAIVFPNAACLPYSIFEGRSDCTLSFRPSLPLLSPRPFAYCPAAAQFRYCFLDARFFLLLSPRRPFRLRIVLPCHPESRSSVPPRRLLGVHTFPPKAGCFRIRPPKAARFTYCLPTRSVSLMCPRRALGLFNVFPKGLLVSFLSPRSPLAIVSPKDCSFQGCSESPKAARLNHCWTARWTA